MIYKYTHKEKQNTIYKHVQNVHESKTVIIRPTVNKISF